MKAFWVELGSHFRRLFVSAPGRCAAGAVVSSVLSVPLWLIHLRNRRNLRLHSFLMPVLRDVTVLVAALSVLPGATGRATSVPAATSFRVSIRVDAGRSLGPLRPVWRFFGADEPNYAYLPDGERLIGELGALRPGEVYFRAHNLLTTGDGTPGLKWGSTNAYREDERGKPVYDWTILDRIFDTYLKHGVRPYVEVGFMPKALSTKPEPYQFTWTPTAKYNEIFLGWTQPPTDYRKWGDLVHAWAAHAVARYGATEVNRWYWETWNEPNIGYWSGTPEEFQALHDVAIDAVRRALPTARVGGPDVAGDGGAFTRAFLEHVLRGTNHATGGQGTPLDFVSFHAKGKPTFVDGHVRMGIAAQLSTIDAGFGLIASYPELKQTPIVIGESDPDGCAACQGAQLGYRNSTVYASYTADAIARTLDLADRRGVNLEGALTWAFEFEGAPLFAGFRALATGPVDLPVLNVFRMLGRMGAERISATSDGAVPLETMMRDGVRARADVAALASRDAARVTILAWHYHDDDVAGPDAATTIRVSGLPADLRRVRVQRVMLDATNGNTFTAAHPDAAELDRLRTASVLPERADDATVSDRSAVLHVVLPRHAVSLVVLSW
jgi:xylan 1,4-beta-xylosidase